MFNLKSSSINAYLISLFGMILITPFIACKSTTSPLTQIVTNIQAKTFTQGSDEWIQVGVSLSTGNFILASVNIPITDPQNRSLIYGQFSLVPILCTPGTTCARGGDIALSLNITQSAHAQSISALLPNGTALPVGGLHTSTLIALPLSDTGAILYFDFSNSVAFLGTAIPFSALDPAGKNIPGVNIFQPANAGPISLNAGMFFGANPKTTGAAFFMNLLGIMPKPAASENLPHTAFTPISFKEIKPSLILQYKMYHELKKLNEQKEILELR